MHMDRQQFLLFQLYFLFNRLAWIIIWGIQGRRKMVKGVYDGIRDFRNGIVGKYGGLLT